MQEERVQDGSLWKHRKDGYLARVEQSSPKGYTYYRRVVSILANGETPIRRPRTVNFVKKFEEASEEVAV